MFAQDAGQLHRLVLAFRQLQKREYPHITEQNDNGEWEIGLPLWQRMNQAYLKLIETHQPDQVDEPLLQDLLYVIARDSECSHLMPRLLNRPAWFELLCRASLAAPYPNARWQFAQQLGSYQGGQQVKALLFRFLGSGEEYTERMALQSLCVHFPDQVERYAARFWQRTIYPEDEYQKIMALWALHEIHSPLLADYIEKAYQTDYHYLKQWADKWSTKKHL